MKFWHLKSSVIVLSIILLAGCATTPAGLAPDARLLEFLQDDRTTREEIVLRLGPPARTLENERLLFYRLGQNSKGYFIREPQHEQWAKVRHSLVLVLDKRGILKKHSLVNVR